MERWEKWGAEAAAARGDESPRNRLEKATKKGLGCPEIQRPRRAMDAGAPEGAGWRTQRRLQHGNASAFPRPQ